MRWTMVALLGSALVARSALAEPEMTFTVEATKKGVPIPQSEIKIVPSAFGRSRKGHGPPPPQPGHGAHRKTRRANPTANSANWCGSVNTTPSNDQITVIHGSFTHPGCTKRTGQSYPQAAASWVGIDGDSWTSALLQAGTVCIVRLIYAHSSPWWQWVPSGAYTISSMPVAVDDWFEITINTTSTTAATVCVTNLSQATSYTISITNGATLARVNADWVIERPYYGASLAGFPTFTDVWFYEAWTTRTGGTGLGILGAKQYQIPSLCASEEWDDEHQVSWSL
ncbi:concanavalin A-like lectin/glucanase [Parathielavia hyrcaniae]|uniref:Concanavalin A-like lectin/glucanase n=1 Tax=Parathielavia hyrcaniae TaxID=113614 RepID=A0AAN6Q411_9PEZI|nr:concanavalin A-like lectin/glucanase [Parathielavia hyrcaniae]